MSHSFLNQKTSCELYCDERSLENGNKSTHPTPETQHMLIYSNMADVDVASVLSAAEKESKEKYKSTEVLKDVEPDLDLGNLLATDHQAIDIRELR